MISDQAKIADIQGEWAALHRLAQSRVYVVPSAAVQFDPPEEIYNLMLVLAYAMLDEALAQLADEQVFNCNKNALLGTRMATSKSALPWQNYALIEKGKAARNRLAHEAKLLSKNDCLHFIEAIGIELKSWKIL